MTEYAKEEKIREKTKDLTEGRPLGLILRFAFPVLLAMLFQQFYNLVDTMIVGRTLGPDALAAVGSTGSLNFLIIGFCSGVCAGFSIPMAQAFGAKNENELKKILGNSFWICLLLALVLTLVTTYFCKELLQLMRTPEDICDAAYSYIVVIFMGIPATFLYNMLSCAIRSVGDSKTPVFFLGLASVLNIILDLLFIVGFHMNVNGAAYATVLSQAASGLLCLWFLKKNYLILQPSRDQWKLCGRVLKKLCANGLPMGLQYSVTAIGSVILQSSVNSLGTFYVASVAAAIRLQCIFSCPFDALGTTIATYAGQNVGANKIGRIRTGTRDCMILGSMYAMIAFAVFFFFGKNLVSLFVNADNVKLIQSSHEYLLWGSGFYIPLAAVNIFRFCIQGMGFGFVSIISGAMEMAARTCIGLFLVPAIGYLASCMASPIAWVSADAFLLPMYFYALKLLNKKLG